MQRWWWLAVLVACVGEEEPSETATAESLFAEASTWGSFGVGYQQQEVAYPNVITGETRTLGLEVWYPAASTEGSTVTYRVAGLAEVPAQIAQDRPVIAPGTHRLAVYSHGSGGLGLVGHPYAELLASHGWVVVAPDHTGNTALDFLFGEGDEFLTTAIHRPADIRAVLDAVEDEIIGLPEGSVQPDEALMFGHSFGAYTTFLVGGATLDPDRFTGGCEPSSTDTVCQWLEDPSIAAVIDGGYADSRVSAVSPQAPAVVYMFDPESISAMPSPVLLMSANDDRTTPSETNAEPAWDLLGREGDAWVRMRKGGHYSFITICDEIDPALLASAIGNADNDGCGPDSTPVTEAVPVLGGYLSAFAKWQLEGEGDFAQAFDANPIPSIRTQR